jgi:hypothetical protein
MVLPVCFFFHTRTSFSNKVVLDMEIQFLHERFTEKDPKFLMDHIRRMGSGEAPFFPTTLSLVYGRLVEKAFPKRTSFGFDLGYLTGGQGPTIPTPILQASTSTSSVASPPTSSFNLQAPAPTPLTTKRVGLKCARCGCIISIYSLYDGLYCPQCPETGRNGKGEKGRPFMRCAGCNALREGHGTVCLKPKCGGEFM